MKESHVIESRVMQAVLTEMPLVVPVVLVVALHPLTVRRHTSVLVPVRMAYGVAPSRCENVATVGGTMHGGVLVSAIDVPRTPHLMQGGICRAMHGRVEVTRMANRLRIKGVVDSRIVMVTGRNDEMLSSMPEDRPHAIRVGARTADVVRMPRVFITRRGGTAISRTRGVHRIGGVSVVPATIPDPHDSSITNTDQTHMRVTDGIYVNVLSPLGAISTLRILGDPLTAALVKRTAWLISGSGITKDSLTNNLNRKQGRCLINESYTNLEKA